MTIIKIYYIFIHTVKNNALKMMVLTSEKLLKSFVLQISFQIFILHGTVLCKDIYHKYNLFELILHSTHSIPVLFFPYVLP